MSEAKDEVAAGADPWSSPGADRIAPGEPSLIVDVEGFEGPLDLLLTLARTQKVDLARISILALAEQYLVFVEEARRLRLELAADYLVMAAWLAYLKSRLLIPDPPADDDEPTGEELAAQLAFRLRRLEAIRRAADHLMDRSRLGRDVFGRGAPEPVVVDRHTVWDATLYDLLAAYAADRQRHMVTRVHVRRRAVWSLVEARDILTRLIGRHGDWFPLETFLKPYMTTRDLAATVRASTFSATLELVREGKMELRQSEAFGPLYVRAAAPRAVDLDALSEENAGDGPGGEGHP
ncbi:segregation and condensation protein A [Chthonobacter rhizosphaerae]|uniref:segregation and condensation protein A n=1 Tax=Chthonobacter rhizosphaerae TaxID=2735553 RepID=UPI0015EE3B2C|nr:ScpA family protein [Chthonobacter rhizosphaerae]